MAANTWSLPGPGSPRRDCGMRWWTTPSAPWGAGYMLWESDPDSQQRGGGETLAVPSHHPIIGFVGAETQPLATSFTEARPRILHVRESFVAVSAGGDDRGGAGWTESWRLGQAG